LGIGHCAHVASAHPAGERRSHTVWPVQVDVTIARHPLPATLHEETWLLDAHWV
jgi:hypothetical protein